MKQYSEAFIAAYYDSIMTCADRYKAMTEDADLVEFLAEFNRDVPLLKLDRWLGYVQGVLIERKATTVQAERDWTRQYFRPLDFCSGFSFDVGDYVIVNEGMGNANYGFVITPGHETYVVNCRYGGTSEVRTGDVLRLATPEEADRYHREVALDKGAKVFDNGEVYTPPSPN